MLVCANPVDTCSEEAEDGDASPDCNRKSDVEAGAVLEA